MVAVVIVSFDENFVIVYVEDFVVEFAEIGFVVASDVAAEDGSLLDCFHYFALQLQVENGTAEHE
jgi:hypothetical protein